MKFPKDHPKNGEPTLFVEKILSGKKLHTIRAGNRWKEGMKFSPRVWSDIPYKSKQFQFAPDIEIKKVWNIEINNRGGRSWFEVLINGKIYGQLHHGFDKDKNREGLELLAKNDGLTLSDFEAWFNKLPFSGQIISWDQNTNY